MLDEFIIFSIAAQSGLSDRAAHRRAAGLTAAHFLLAERLYRRKALPYMALHAAVLPWRMPAILFSRAQEPAWGRTLHGAA
jgi:hypothetical protein